MRMVPGPGRSPGLWVILLIGPSHPDWMVASPMFIATYSCGAARDLHPLPYSSAFTKRYGGHPNIIGRLFVAEAIIYCNKQHRIHKQTTFKSNFRNNLFFRIQRRLNQLPDIILAIF